MGIEYSDDNVAKKKPFYEEFEGEVREMLTHMGFKDVRGGTGFKVGPLQVDACGGHEDVLLVVECTATKGKIKEDLREKIKSFRGIRVQVENAAQKDNLFAKYKRFCYVIATNAQIKEADKEFASQTPVVHLWDRQIMNHYEQLAASIGEYARYGLLGELDIEPMVESHFQIPAFRIRAGNSELYEFFTDAKHLLTVAYVARREIGQELYYQRMVKPARLGRITSYVKEEKRIFPNSIVVAFVGEPKFTSLTGLLDQSKQGDMWPDWIQVGILSFPKTYRACWIVDGQHRLYGLAKAPETRIPVTAFGRLKPEDQARYFLDINGEQRRVAADLIWDLSGELMPNEDSGRISNIVKKLDETGPLRGNIYIPLHGSKGTKPVKIASLCQAVKRVALIRDHTLNMRGGEVNPLIMGKETRDIVNTTSSALSAFFEMIQKTFVQEPDKPDYLHEFFFDNTGAGLLILLFERMLVCLGRIPTERDTIPYVTALRAYVKNAYSTQRDVRDLRKACTGESGRGLVADEFCAQTNSLLDPSLSSLPLSREAGEVDKEYKIMEQKLRTLVGHILRKAAKRDWVKERVPLEMARKLESNRSNKETALWEYLTLGECKTLILNGANWPLFKDIFVGSDAGFSNQQMFSESFQLFIEKGRNPQIHGRVAGTKYGDLEILKGVKKKLESCIEQGLHLYVSKVPETSGDTKDESPE